MSRLFIILLILFAGLVILRVVFFFAFPLAFANGEKISFTTTIFEEPKVLGNTQQVLVRLGNFWHSVPVTIVTTAEKPLFYGDSVKITGRVTHILLKDKRLVTAIYFPQIEADKKGIIPIFAKIRQEIVAFCENTFSQPYSGLLAGMLLGVKNTLPDNITRSFRITGVSHVVAASGMNVTLVVGFLLSFLDRFCRRQVAVLLSLFGILGYIVLAGLDASILRAGVMGILVLGAQLFGRQYTALYSLFLTTGLLLFWDPLLVQDIGFQLSVFSTSGIIFLKPFIPLSGFLLDDIGTTVAAQIGTLPLLLGTFGNYGVLSLLVNALVLWTIPPLTIVGGIGVTLGFIFAPLGRVILLLTYPLLWYFETVVAYFAQFHLLWQVGGWSFFWTVGYYLMLSSLLVFLRIQQEQRLTTLGKT